LYAEKPIIYYSDSCITKDAVANSKKKQSVAKGAPESFISYSRKDSEFALRLAKDLRAAGVSVWLDQLNIIPGQLFRQAIEAAVKNSPYMLVILSPAAVMSQEVHDEFEYALDEEKTVIPVFHRDCDVPFRLRSRQRADFRSDYDSGFQQLLKALVSAKTAGPSKSATLPDESKSSAKIVPQVGRAQSQSYAGTPELFVTLQGGLPELAQRKNNVRAYDEDGNLITPSILADSAGLLLDQLRGICVAGKYLYVVNANKLQNSVLCYEGAGNRYKFVGWFASRRTCKAILHPFDLCFDGLGYCYLSNQDTNVVTRFVASDGGKIGEPAPLASALPTTGKFLPGTFVASSRGDLFDLPTTPVGAPAGLGYSAFAEKKLSVRGITWANGRLYVADRAAGTVKMYDITGAYLGQSNEVETPVQILAHHGSLYVSGGDVVLTAKLRDSLGDFVLRPISTARVKNSSGMAFGKSGHFFVASRTERLILKFDSNFKRIKNFRCYLPDNPQFLCPAP
jgi:DNA-binding beta-propeller fold protein YncE